MTLEEIFDESGLYRADSFADGICFEVTEDGNLYWCEYENKETIFPTKRDALVYRDLFKKDYQKVFNKGQLFRK